MRRATFELALEDAGGVISRAARLLGLRGHQNLHYMLKNRSQESSQCDSEDHTAGQRSDPDKDATRVSLKWRATKTQTVRILHVEDDPTVAALVQEITQTKAGS